MVCIHCGANTKVINSRLQKRANQVWRRRQCLSCSSIFTTEERPQYEASWLTKTRRGQLTPFLRDKLFLSIYQSCQHRPTALSDASALADTVIKRLATQLHSGVLDTQVIQHNCEVALTRFDKVASVHYKAFHA